MGLFGNRRRRRSRAEADARLVHPDPEDLLRELDLAAQDDAAAAVVGKGDNGGTGPDNSARRQRRGSLVQRFRRQLSSSVSEASLRSEISEASTPAHAATALRRLEEKYCAKFDATEFSMLRSRQRVEIFKAFAEDVRHKPSQLQRISVAASLCKVLDRASSRTGHEMMQPAVHAFETLLCSETAARDDFLADVLRFGDLPFIASRLGAAAVAHAEAAQEVADARAWLQVALSWLRIMATLAPRSKPVREIFATPDMFEFAFAVHDRAHRMRFDSGPEALRVRERADVALLDFCASMAIERHGAEVLASCMDGALVATLAARAAHFGFARKPAAVDAAAKALANIVARSRTLAFDSPTTRRVAEALLKLLNTELGYLVDELLARDDLNEQHRERIDGALRNPGGDAEGDHHHHHHDVVGRTSGLDDDAATAEESLFATRADVGPDGRSKEACISAYLDLLRAALGLAPQSLLHAGAVVADTHAKSAPTPPRRGGAEADDMKSAKASAEERLLARVRDIKAVVLRDPALVENAVGHLWAHLLRVVQLGSKNFRLVDDDRLALGTFFAPLHGTSRNFTPCTHALEITRRVLVDKPRSRDQEPSETQVRTLLELCEQLMLRDDALDAVGDLLGAMVDLLARRDDLGPEVLERAARVLENLGARPRVLRAVVAPQVVNLVARTDTQHVRWVVLSALHESVFPRDDAQVGRTRRQEWARALVAAGLLRSVTPQLALLEPESLPLIQILVDATAQCITIEAAEDKDPAATPSEAEEEEDLVATSTEVVGASSTTRADSLKTEASAALRAASFGVCRALFELVRGAQKLTLAASDSQSGDQVDDETRSRALHCASGLFMLGSNMLQLESAARRREIVQEEITPENLACLSRALSVRLRIFHGTLSVVLDKDADGVFASIEALVYWLAQVVDARGFDASQGGDLAEETLKDLLASCLDLLQVDRLAHHDPETHRFVLYVLFRLLHSKVDPEDVPALTAADQRRFVASTLMRTLSFGLVTGTGISGSSPAPQIALAVDRDRRVFAGLVLLHLTCESPAFCATLLEAKRLEALPHAVLLAWGASPGAPETRSIELSVAGVLFTLLEHPAAERLLCNEACVEATIGVVQKHCELAANDAQTAKDRDDVAPTDGLLLFLGVIFRLAQGLERIRRGPTRAAHRAQLRAMRSLYSELVRLQVALQKVNGLGKYKSVLPGRDEDAQRRVLDLLVAAREAIMEIFATAPAQDPAALRTKNYQLLLKQVPPGLCTLDTLAQLQHARLAKLTDRNAAGRSPNQGETRQQPLDEWTRAYHEALLASPGVREEFRACEDAARAEASREARRILREARVKLAPPEPAEKERARSLRRDLDEFFRENILTRGIVDMTDEERARYDLSSILGDGSE